jgi:DNA-binding MarR family transcriptional regulator
MERQRATSGLHDHTGYWLRRLSDLVHRAFERELAAHGVTVAQWNVLIALHRGDAQTPLELARFIDIDTGAVARLVDRLGAKGLVVRLPDPADRRSVRLALTDEAGALIVTLAGLADANDRRFFGALSADEHRQLRALVSRVLAAHNIATPPGWSDR